MSNDWPVIKDIVSAEKLRRYANISRVRDEKKRSAPGVTGEDSLEQQKKLFLQAQFVEHEFESLKLKILDAARQGKHAVEVMKFPAAFCADSGRAINNSEQDWPQTLQGKALSFYDIWREHGQPNGYRLKIKINDYPGGFIGSVSLFIDWS